MVGIVGNKYRNSIMHRVSSSFAFPSVIFVKLVVFVIIQKLCLVFPNLNRAVGLYYHLITTSVKN